MADPLYSTLQRHFEDPILDRFMKTESFGQINVSGAVIILGMVEKAVFYSEYSTMNKYGENVDGVIEVWFLRKLQILVKMR